ncbi:MAG: hypothetical protein V1707_02840 [bacterium]
MSKILCILLVTVVFGQVTNEQLYYFNSDTFFGTADEAKKAIEEGKKMAFITDWSDIKGSVQTMIINSAANKDSAEKFLSKAADFIFVSYPKTSSSSEAVSIAREIIKKGNMDSDEIYLKTIANSNDGMFKIVIGYGDKSLNSVSDVEVAKIINGDYLPRKSFGSVGQAQPNSEVCPAPPVAPVALVTQSFPPLQPMFHDVDFQIHVATQNFITDWYEVEQLSDTSYRESWQKVSLGAHLELGWKFPIDHSVLQFYLLAGVWDFVPKWNNLSPYYGMIIGFDHGQHAVWFQAFRYSNYYWRGDLQWLYRQADWQKLSVGLYGSYDRQFQDQFNADRRGYGVVGRINLYIFEGDVKIGLADVPTKERLDARGNVVQSHSVKPGLRSAEVKVALKWFFNVM